MSKPETSGMLLERVVKYLVIHCSAAHYGDAATPVYHFYIARDGHVRQRLPLSVQGCHAKGFDRCSVGICYEGGLDERGHPADTRTDFQKHSLRVLVMLLLRDYPGSRLCGHRDLSPDLDCNGEIEPEEWIKACPCFDAASILQDSVPPNPAYL